MSPPSPPTLCFSPRNNVRDRTGLRDALRHEQQTRKVTEATLRAERLRRDEVETAMQDTQRELQQPFVVPALLDAFMKIGQMTGDAIKDAHGSSIHPMEL